MFVPPQEGIIKKDYLRSGRKAVTRITKSAGPPTLPTSALDDRLRPPVPRRHRQGDGVLSRRCRQWLRRSTRVGSLQCESVMIVAMSRNNIVTLTLIAPAPDRLTGWIGSEALCAS